MHAARHTLLLPHARTHPLSSQLVWDPGRVEQHGHCMPAINKIILYNVGTRTETLQTNASTQIKSNGQPDSPPAGGVPGCPASPGPRGQNNQASEVKVRGEPPVLSSKFAFSLVCGSGRSGGGVVLPAAVTSLVHPWHQRPPAGTPTVATAGRGSGHLDDRSDAPLGRLHREEGAHNVYSRLF